MGTNKNAVNLSQHKSADVMCCMKTFLSGPLGAVLRVRYGVMPWA